MWQMASILCLNTAKNNPQITTRERGREMWLLWLLPKNRPRPGSMCVSTENQIWPHFPGNHLQPPLT
ncbi:hypothetical protein ILYODFUR_029787 [Ilyodon furcidens]|uniref:Uncharacterized protein n=2 Tax=Goodeidae TaxID=28758 RepID=A0ABU7BP62_9TELE|nr:hypothetical protein [Ataeniobius toweri]